MTVEVNAAVGMSLPGRVAGTKQCAQCKLHLRVICTNPFRPPSCGPDRKKQEFGAPAVAVRQANTGSIRCPKGSDIRLWLTRSWS
jgi:hypothetical protein